MKKSEWSDKQLEDLFRQMPKIQDHRHPRDIYQNLSLKRRKRPIHWVPYVAAAAALFLFFILVPNLMGDFSVTKGSQDQASSAKKMDVSAEKQSSKMENRSFAGAQTLTGGDSTTAVYEGEALTGQVLTYWIPDVNARFLIPVSTIVTETGDKPWIALYNEKMSALQEENWGLSEYYPMDATFKMDRDSVIVDVAPDNHYGDGSTSETTFLEALKRDFSANHNVNKIIFTTNSQQGIELGNTGKINELKIKDDQNSRHAYFFYTPKGSTTPFLVPSSEKYNDIMTALTAMDSDILGMDLKASLGSFNIKDATIQGKTLFISLNSKKDLVNDVNTIHSFEALLLTAKDFGAEYVLIKNPSISSLGTFDITKEVKVPVAPNLRYLQ